MIGIARKLASKYADRSDAGEDEYDWELVRELAAHGLTGIDLPSDLGGQDGSLLDAVLVLEAVGSTAPQRADDVHTTSFGAIRQIARFAETDVLQDIARQIVAGQALASIAMSEPSVGSALSHLTSRASINGGQVTVTGQKLFNTNGPYATHYVVWVRFGPAITDIGAVVVPNDSRGFARGATERFISGEVHCALYFDDVVLPEDYVLLREDGIRRMFSIFNIERLGNASRSLAFGELALSLAQHHMIERTTGGRSLADLQGLRWKLADMRMALDAARLLVYRAATELGADGAPTASNVAIAKASANVAGFDAADQAMQIMGGYGYTAGSPVDYLWRRTRGWKIAGGSIEVLKNRIADEMFKQRVPGMPD